MWLPRCGYWRHSNTAMVTRAHFHFSALLGVATKLYGTKTLRKTLHCGSHGTSVLITWGASVWCPAKWKHCRKSFAHTSNKANDQRHQQLQSETAFASVVWQVSVQKMPFKNHHHIRKWLYYCRMKRRSVLVEFTLTVVVFAVRSFTRSNSVFSCSSPSCLQTQAVQQVLKEVWHLAGKFTAWHDWMSGW